MSNESLATNVSLCDALDRILTQGVVAYGDITISVAGVDLLYVGLRGLLCAIDALGELPPSLNNPHFREELAKEVSAVDTEGRPS